MRATILAFAFLVSLPIATHAQSGPANTVDGQTQTQRKPPTPPPPPPDEALPGSMVGYIDDATIRTQVRVRFDSAYDDTAPDRAEFFYAKCGCYRNIQAGINFDPNAPGPGPGVPDSVNFQEAHFNGQVALMKRLGVFADLPLRWLQAQPQGVAFDNASGIGDIRAGAKVAVVATDQTTVSVQLQGYFPSGDASKGLGTNHKSLETSVLFFDRIAPTAAIEGEFGDWHPFGGSDGITVTGSNGLFVFTDKKFAGDVLYYGIGPSFAVVHTPKLSVAPVVELVGWHVVNGFVTGPVGDATGTNIVNLKFGARVTFNRQSSIYVGYGHALTTDTWYSNILRIEFRRAF